MTNARQIGWIAATITVTLPLWPIKTMLLPSIAPGEQGPNEQTNASGSTGIDPWEHLSKTWQTNVSTPLAPPTGSPPPTPLFTNDAHASCNPSTPSCHQHPSCPLLREPMDDRWLIDRDGDGVAETEFAFTLPTAHQTPDEFLVGNWDGIDGDNLGIRVGNRIYLDTDFDSATFEITFEFGDGQSQYLVGDWDGDGDDNIATRSGNHFVFDLNFNSLPDGERIWGRGEREDEYLIGDWDGDGDDDLAVRRGNRILMSADSGADGSQLRPDGGLASSHDGIHDRELTFGRGNRDETYLIGDWDRDGKDDIAVRNGTCLEMSLSAGAHAGHATLRLPTGRYPYVAGTIGSMPASPTYPQASN